MAKRLLIVDDDLYIRELYEEVLKGEGFEVDSAVDGEDGLFKLKKGGYDVVLLDVMMPKIDGLGVLDGLQMAKPEKPNGTILLLTNLGHDPVIQEALKKGATSYLIKADLTPDQLVQHIKQYTN